jgi:hypothetical protein
VIGAARRSSVAFAAAAASANFSLRFFPVIIQSFLLFQYFISGIQEEDSCTNKLGLTLRKKLKNWCILSISLYGAGTRALGK